MTRTAAHHPGSIKIFLATILDFSSSCTVCDLHSPLINNPKHLASYLYLSLGHDLVRRLAVLFALLGFVAALLVAEQPQRLRALQFNLELLAGRRKHRTDVLLQVSDQVEKNNTPTTPTCALTSFQLGSVESRCTRVLALLTK